MARQPPPLPLALGWTHGCALAFDQSPYAEIVIPSHRCALPDANVGGEATTGLSFSKYVTPRQDKVTAHNR
jgi:hypothetical protein